MKIHSSTLAVMPKTGLFECHGGELTGSVALAVAHVTSIY